MKKQYLVPGEFRFEVARGTIAKHTQVDIFGFKPDVSTTVVQPISIGGIYRTPLEAVPLRVVSTSANDTAAGTGARKVRLTGLNSSWQIVTEDLSMAGLTPVLGTVPFLRLHQAEVIDSGTYATQSAGSHAGTITISDGTNTWATIDSITLFPSGRTTIGAYTVPAGYDAVLTNVIIHADANKSVSVLMFARQNNRLTAPYDAMKLLERWEGITGTSVQSYDGGFFLTEKTDFGFLAKTISQEAAVSVDAEMILIARGQGL